MERLAQDWANINMNRKHLRRKTERTGQNWIVGIKGSSSLPKQAILKLLKFAYDLKFVIKLVWKANDKWLISLSPSLTHTHTPYISGLIHDKMRFRMMRSSTHVLTRARNHKLYTCKDKVEALFLTALSWHIEDQGETCVMLLM